MLIVTYKFMFWKTHKFRRKAYGLKPRHET